MSQPVKVVKAPAHSVGGGFNMFAVTGLAGDLNPTFDDAEWRLRLADNAGELAQTLVSLL